MKTLLKVCATLLIASYVVGGALMLFLFHSVLHWGYYSIVVNNGWAGFSPSMIMYFDALVITSIIVSVLIALFAKPRESEQARELVIS